MVPDAESNFGKYRLIERIAVGGMAEIYRARYEAAAGVTRHVVVKKILPAFAGNRHFIAMFVNEAKIAVGLSHGNIAQVFDFGEIDDEYFLAMEYVPGQTLSKAIKKARAAGMPALPLPYAGLVAVELCNGLHYAHTRLGEDGLPLGIIHRDVTPQNVLLSWEGQVKIVDFGIAKARHASGEKTATGAIKGKYLYFSPEQASGRDLDARSDIYSAGIVLYEMLCGRRPFEGKMMEVLSQIIRGDFDRPRSVNAHLPAEMEEIILKAMSTDRSTRYQSAQEMAKAISAFLHAQAPGISTSSLEHFMSFLYEKELLKEGKPVRIPPEFIRELEHWRDPRSAGDGSTPPRASSPGRRATPGQPLPAQRAGSPLQGKNPEASIEPARAFEHDWMAPQQAPPRRTPRWVFVAAPLAAALLAGLFVLLIGLRQASIRITSEPAGARVLIDGSPAPEVTPLEIRGLKPGEPHRIELRAAGMRTWQSDVTPKPGETVALEVRLEPLAPAPPRTSPVRTPP